MLVGVSREEGGGRRGARKLGEMRVLCCDPPSPAVSAMEMAAQSEIATAAVISVSRETSHSTQQQQQQQQQCQVISHLIIVLS